MVENQHTTKRWAWLSTNCCILFWRSSLHTCISINSSIGLDSCPRTITCKIKKKLSDKYIYKKRTNQKMDAIKKNLTIIFACENERNGATGVRDNRTVNLSAPVPSTELWPSCDTCKHHMLNVFRPSNLRDVWRSEILPNCHIISAW